MKVLQINSVCGFGSTGRIVTDIYKLLEENGHECLIAYGRGTAPKGINSIRIGTNFDNYMHVLNTRIFDNHGFASTKATKEFINKVEEFNPDVIHLHNIHGYYINIELLFNYLKKINKPVVWTLHDCWTFTGHCAHFEYNKCEKWKKECNYCSQKKSYPKSLLKDRCSLNYKMKKELFTSIKNMTIVTPSEWLAGLVRESFLKKYSVKVINNGIDLNVFRPMDKNRFRKKYDIEDKFIILGVASIWGERKGLNYFQKISKIIDNNSKIILIGLNDNQLRNLPKNIIGIRRTSSMEELGEIYSAADVFVNPTLEDNFPTTNIEALACGTSVITFNTGGSAESIDKTCGIIVRQGNVKSLLEAISICKISNFDSNNCLDRAKLYDKNVKFNEYIVLYNEVYKWENSIKS